MNRKTLLKGVRWELLTLWPHVVFNHRGLGQTETPGLKRNPLKTSSHEFNDNVCADKQER